MDSYALGYMIETDMSRFVAMEDLSKVDHVRAPPMLITFTAPTSGTKFYLVLRAQKNGTTVFEETDESFTLQ